MVQRKLIKDEINLIPKEVLEVFNLFENAGKELFLVGGGVRSILQTKIPMDCDFATNATPEESLKIIAHLDPYYENDFGTVSYAIETDRGKEVYEVTTYRADIGYSDFRRPDKVQWGTKIEEDIKRRDFTINAVVIGRCSGGWMMIDEVGGLADFENRMIRTVGEARERFTEDALRMMRAIRFATRLGYSLEEETLSAIKDLSHLLSKISKERIREELMKIVESDYPADGVMMLVDSGLMKEIVPELLEGLETEQGGHHTQLVFDHQLEALRNCASSDVIVRLATLLHDVAKPRTQRFKCRKCGYIHKKADLVMMACQKCGKVQNRKSMITFYGHEVIGARMVREIAERLRFSKKETDRLELLTRRHMFAYQREMTDSAIRRLIRNIGKENIADMMMLRIADRKGSGSKTTSWRLLELQKRIGEQLYQPMEVKDLVIGGREVMSILKISAGPEIGRVLNTLFEEVLQDPEKNNQEYLTSRVREIASDL
jgi:tRNA nucleotidyltransferase (CCA-adding enzyme)